MIVRTPDLASASMSARSNLPAALRPAARSARGGSDGGMARLRNSLRVTSQPAAVASPEKSGGVLSRPLDQVASPDPKSLEPTQRQARRLQIGLGDRGLGPPLCVP